MEVVLFTFEANDDRRHSGEYPYDILYAGTEDLHRYAVEKVCDRVKDEPSAHEFYAEFLRMNARRQHDPHFRFTDPPAFPPLMYAIMAIEAVMDAKVQNIMANPDLASQFNHDRQAVTASYYVANTAVEIIRDALMMWRAYASQAQSLSQALARID